MTSTRHEELIARLEASSGDRELDALIYISSYKSAYPDETAEVRIEYARRCAPHYTSSIDAALTLIPDGMEWSVTTLYGVAAVEMGLNCDNLNGPSYAHREDCNVAIAICIASLKARTAQ